MTANLCQRYVIPWLSLSLTHSRRGSLNIDRQIIEWFFDLNFDIRRKSGRDTRLSCRPPNRNICGRGACCCCLASMKYKKENQNQNMFQINVVVACCVSPYQYRFAVHEKLFDPTMNMLERDVCIWQRRTTADDPKTQQQQKNRK